MKKEDMNELKKFFEKNSKKIENKEKEKTKQVEKGGKGKSNTICDKDMKDKNNINKSVYVKSTQINKMKTVFNKENNSKEIENKLETIKQNLAPVKNKKEDKKIETKNETYIEIKKLRSSAVLSLKSNLKDIVDKIPNEDTKENNLEITTEKIDIKTQDDSIPSNSIKDENNDENKKENEININFKDKVAMFNNFIEKNKKEEISPQDFYTRGTTYYIKDTIKNITDSNFDKNNNELNEYKQTFNTLHNLQTVLKKESSLRELCKNKIIILFFLII